MSALMYDIAACRTMPNSIAAARTKSKPVNRWWSLFMWQARICLTCLFEQVFGQAFGQVVAHRGPSRFEKSYEGSNPTSESDQDERSEFQQVACFFDFMAEYQDAEYSAKRPD